MLACAGGLTRYHTATGSPDAMDLTPRSSDSLPAAATGLERLPPVARFSRDMCQLRHLTRWTVLPVLLRAAVLARPDAPAVGTVYTAATAGCPALPRRRPLRQHATAGVLVLDCAGSLPPASGLLYCAIRFTWDRRASHRQPVRLQPGPLLFVLLYQQQRFCRTPPGDSPAFAV